MKRVRILEIISGPDRGKAIELSRQENVLGRGTEAHVVINDHDVSREHCRLTIKGSGVTVSDLQSTNGTWVNDKRVDKVKLASGDVLRVGGSELRLVTKEVEDEPRAEASASPRRRLSGLAALGGLSWPNRVLAIMALVVLLSQPLVAWPLISAQEEALIQEARRRASALVLALASANREALRLGEDILVDTSLVAKEDGVVEASLLDRGGRVVAPAAKLHQRPADARTQKALASETLLIQMAGPQEIDLALPIRALDPATGVFSRVGTARLIFTLQGVGQLTGGLRLVSLISLLAYLALGSAAAWLLMRLTRRPLLRLRDDIEAGIKGDLEQVTPSLKFPELDQLASSINRALAKLAQSQAAPPPPPAPVAAPAARPSAAQGLGLKDLAAMLGEAVLVLDGGNLLMMANSAACAALGSSQASLQGRHLLEIIPDKALLAQMLSLMEQAKASGGGPLSAGGMGADGGLSVAVRMDLAPDGEPRSILLTVAGWPMHERSALP